MGFPQDFLMRTGTLCSKDDIVIAVMGVTGAGKSSFISLLSDEDIGIGHGLQSCEFTIHSVVLDSINLTLYQARVKSESIPINLTESKYGLLTHPVLMIRIASM
jgi:ATPase subunit of ABC transporter with duplicated ATPase domains